MGSSLSTTAAETGAYRALERALTRRRLRSLDPRLALEVVAIALLLAAVLFWQVRLPLDGWARRGGAFAVSSVAAILFAVVALACAATTAIGMSRALSGARDGPEWLALPLDPRSVRRHLEWNARTPLPFFLLAQLAIAIALHGLAPIAVLLALTAAAFGATVAAARGGPRLVMHFALAGGEADEPRALAIVLARAGRTVRARLRAGAPWRALSPLGAILELDRRLTARERRPRGRALVALLLAAAAAAMWFTPWHPALRRAVSFGLALLASTSTAEWLIDLTGLHPFAALRTLPIGVAAFWGARAAVAAAASAAIVATQLSAAWLMAPAALAVHLVWTGAAALVISCFGANLAVTLYPRADHARRVLMLSLALAATASYILTLAGWVLLLTGLIHSARRLPSWTRGESLS